MLTKKLVSLITSTSLKLNMVWSGLFWLTNIITSLILIRVVLKYITLSDYGYWAAFLALSSYLTLSDLGLGPTLTRYISDKQLKPSKKQYLISFITAIETIAATIFSLVIFLIYYFLYRHQLILLFSLVLLAQFLNQLGMNFLAIINGIQKIVLVNTFLIIKTLIYFFLTLLLLSSWHLLALAIAFLASGVFLIFSGGFLVWWYFRPQIPNFSLKDKELLKNAFNFSKTMFGLKILGLTRNQFNRIVLSVIATPELTAIVDLARKLINPIRGVFISVISPTFPLFSNLISQNKNSQINSLLRKTFFGGAVILIISMVILLFIAPWGIQIWLGPSFLKILPALYILISSEFINLLMYPVNLKILAGQEHNQLLIFTTIATISQLGLSLLILIFSHNYLYMLATFSLVEFIKFIFWLFTFKNEIQPIFNKLPFIINGQPK